MKDKIVEILKVYNRWIKSLSGYMQGYYSKATEEGVVDFLKFHPEYAHLYSAGEEVSDDFEPFSKEWEAELMKVKKADLIFFYKRALMWNQQSKPTRPTVSEEEITFEQCLREEFLISTQNYPKEYHNLFHKKFKRAESRFKELLNR